MIEKRKINIRGERFWNLVALEPTGKVDKFGDSIWKFKCDCGTVFECSNRRVRRGYVRDCGCKPSICEICGKEFKPPRRNIKTCSPECREARKQKMSHTKPRKKRKKTNLLDVIVEARKAGMSYGEYQAKKWSEDVKSK